VIGQVFFDRGSEGLRVRGEILLDGIVHVRTLHLAMRRARHCNCGGDEHSQRRSLEPG